MLISLHRSEPVSNITMHAMFKFPGAHVADVLYAVASTAPRLCLKRLSSAERALSRFSHTASVDSARKT